MKGLGVLLAAVVIGNAARAEPVDPNWRLYGFMDTEWRVVAFEGEAWFVEPDQVIGKTQTFYKGWAEGAFFDCDYLGRSMTYTRLSMEAFLANPAFADFAPAAGHMRDAGEVAFVHRTTCEGDGDATRRRVLYPFVTTETHESAFYLFEGGVFILRNAVDPSAVDGRISE